MKLTELERREHTYREGRPPLELRVAWAILVDDGIGPEATMRSAVRAVTTARGVARIVIAVKNRWAAADTCRHARKKSRKPVCLLAPESFHGVGQFSKSSDE